MLDFLMMIWYIWIYRDITFGKRSPLCSLARDVFGVFKIGIVLTVAYQVSHLILAFDRQFVNVLFSTEDFAVYSFAYNIVSMISTMISSLSIVLLTMLKRATKEYILGYYKKSLVVVSAVVGLSLFSYFPLTAFIRWFLPDYYSSLEYVAIVLPSVLFTSCITVVMFTVDKVLNMSFAFFKNGCIILLLGLFTNSVAYVVFKTPQSISYASLFTMSIWFILEGLRLGKHTGVKVYKEFFYLLILAFAFVAITQSALSVIWSAFAYLIAYLLITSVMYLYDFKFFLNKR